MSAQKPATVAGDGDGERVAQRITRGARRLMDALGYATVCELTLPNGRRADIVALSSTGEVVIVEVKSCAVDFRSDHKWPEYVDYCDRLFFAIADDGPAELIPEYVGLIVSDAYSAYITRETAAGPLPPARRRAMLLSFARHAAARLHALQDPELANGRETR